ncbi:hypothetical protein D3C77_725040 [compost metagenome]
MYGTCSRLAPVRCLKSSSARWCGEPAPAEAAVSLPGSFLAAASTSSTVLYGELTFTASSSGNLAMPPM